LFYNFRIVIIFSIENKHIQGKHIKEEEKLSA